MEVLKDNFNDCSKESYVNKCVEPYPRKHICENCQSELEYDESDLYIGFLGCAYLDCPLCEHRNMLEENENAITLTKDSVEFPTHFWYSSKETGAFDCCNNEEIKKAINEAVEYFRKNKDEYHWFQCGGNLYISVDRYDGDEDYWVVVSDNYYETHIPFELRDYE